MSPVTTTIFTAELSVNPVNVDVIKPEVVKPSLRTRIVAKVAAASLAVLQTILRVRDGLIRLSEKFFSLFKRSKNNSVPAPTISPFVESPLNNSPVNKSPLKQDPPTVQVSPFEVKDKELTPKQKPKSTPLSPDYSPSNPDFSVPSPDFSVPSPDFSVSSPISPISSVDEQMPNLSPFTSDDAFSDSDSTEISTPVIDEPTQPTVTEKPVETVKEVAKVQRMPDYLIKGINKTNLFATGSMILGGLIGYYFGQNNQNASYDQGLVDGYNKCLSRALS